MVGLTASPACVIITPCQRDEYIYHAEWAYGLSLLSSPGAGAQPDDVFRLGGDPRYYRWSAANAGPGHDAGAGRLRTVPFSDPLRALLADIASLFPNGSRYRTVTSG